MNRIYKIVWSKAKNTYVVASELAKSHTKSASGKAVKTAMAAAVGGGLLFGGYVGVYAVPATNPPGGGPGVAIGTGSSSNNANSVAVGSSAKTTGAKAVAVGNGAIADSTSTVAVGDGANVASNVDLVGGIAIGKKAYVLNGGGRQEAELGLDRNNWPSFIFGAYNNPIDKNRVATGIAIGTNAYARTGSVQLGAHTYVGTMGGTQVNASTNSEGAVVNMTTVGSNSYNKAIFGTMVGAYSIATGDFDGNSNFYVGQNFGSSVVGSLNSIRTKGHGRYSGIANSIVGLANMTENTNGSLIFGAGNNITNSIKTISGLTSGAADADAMSAKLRRAIQDNESGGAMMAIGGGNTADYAQVSRLVGVGNKLTGTSAVVSRYNMLDGYKNTASNVQHVSVIGSENEVENTNDALVLGNKRKLAGANGSVILGSGDSVITTNVENAVSIGHNANVQKAGGVALGSGSVASVDKGVAGYDPSTKAASTDTSSTWKATEAAVSVGDVAGRVTRQITGVAAGAQDTDAVNVAQLKQVEAKADAADKKHTTVKAGDYATVTVTTNAVGRKEYTVSGPKMASTDGTVTISDKVENGKKVGYDLSVNTSGLVVQNAKVEAGENVTVTSQKNGNTTTYTVNAKDTVVTGGTASYAANGTGTATLINNDGTTATITGLQDRYTSSAALDGNTLNFTRNDGSAYSVSGIASMQDIKNVTNKVGELGTRVNRVGAGAAALAALHPLDFDPDDKWDVAAGYGNYKDAHAVAVGAFYRPNEDTMFSVGGSFGGGENMVNAGVSVKLGQGNHVSTSKVAMAKEIVDLRDENKDLKKRLDTMEQKMNSILGILDMGKKKDFPDVPENHWAYEYVATLAGNGILEGYPDGMFSGERSMTRYEFAAMFYRALKNGAPVDDNMDRAMNEFEPELRQIRLDRIRVDRISGKDNDRNKVERVRVNSEDDKANNDYRDVYGSHISPKA